MLALVRDENHVKISQQAARRGGEDPIGVHRGQTGSRLALNTCHTARRPFSIYHLCLFAGNKFHPLYQT